MITSDRLRSEVFFKAVRSRGPGGQNVNKVSSAAIMYWDFLFSSLLNEDQKRRVRLRLHAMINSENQLYVRSDEFRDLGQNKARCLEKMAALVTAALHVPKKRKATKPTFASKQKRQESKRRRGEIKKLRGRVDD
ncbi:MAG: aminoacyl-tRNA hydrolase [Bdellovibrionales bacterium]|nr:aminoacyl-tRNA hydrolase [Bdellovibrionales bacterium]